MKHSIPEPGAPIERYDLSGTRQSAAGGERMPGRDVVVVGGSAGSIEALIRLVASLPHDFAAAVLVVVHMPSQATSALPAILDRAGPLAAGSARDGAPIRPGRVYVATPDHHLLVHRGRIELGHGARENRHRPAVDPLFRSAARAYGPRVVGVVLSGSLDDGTAGLVAIKRMGGVAVVQEPDEALFPSMPLSALAHVAVDHRLPVGEMGALLTRLAAERVDGLPRRADDEMEQEVEIAELDEEALQGERPGKPASLACPDCGGTLWELQEGDLLRFRCRVGHAFSAEALLAAENEALEGALWAALRTLKETIELSRRMAARAADRAQTGLAKRFEERAAEAEQRAEVIRRVLSDGPPPLPEA
jgi:two-component system chemotaxis response regulator CheB